MPAIVDLVPPEIVLTFTAFLEFCYIVRMPTFDETALNALDDALERFCEHRKIFVSSGVRPDGISLPRQHSIQHYHWLIEQFGAPDGLSSSLTESAHIAAVKEPWKRSSHFEELLQILITNQRMNNLAAFHSRLFSAGLLDVPLLPKGTQAIAMNSGGTHRGHVNDSETFETIVQFSERPGGHTIHFHSIINVFN